MSEDIFEKHRVDIIQSIDTDKQYIFSYLRSKFVLDDEDCERICHGVTRQEKVSKMLDILALKGDEAIKHFVDAVEVEHPKLYEKITGKKAESCISNLAANSKDCILTWTHGLDGKALIDFDRQFLAKQLDRAMTDLKCMSYWQSKILEEKSLLEKKLFEATDDLQIKDKSMQDLQEKIIEYAAERRAVETEEDALQTRQPMQFYLQELWQDNLERSNVIIALQGRLLVANEQIDQLKKDNLELAEKNDKFKNELRNLTIVYDHERRNSRKLNETMMTQTTEVDVLNREMLKWKYDYHCLLEEKESLQNELETFQKWTEILNARFDIVTHKNNELEENSEDLCSHVRSLQTRCDATESKLAFAEFDNERLRLEVERLKAVNESLREHRNALNVARETAIVSRDIAVKEKLAREKEFLSIQEKLEEVIQKHVEMYETMESKLSQALNDLADAEQKVSKKEKEFVEFKISYESGRCNSDAGLIAAKNQKTTDKAHDANQESTALDSSDGTSITVPYQWQKRSHKELIESIRRKVTPELKSPGSKGGSLPANMNLKMVKGLLDYEQLSLIYPQHFNQCISKSLPRDLTQSGLHLNITGAKAYSSCSSRTSRNLNQVSPLSISPCVINNSQSSALATAVLTRQSKVDCKDVSLQDSQERTRIKYSASEDNEQFRSRLYCMDSTMTVMANRCRSVSSPAIIANEVQSDCVVKKAESR